MKLSPKLFEVCRQDGSLEQREAAAFVLAGQYVLAGDHDRALEAARSIHMPQADPRIMEAAALAASGKLDEAESIEHLRKRKATSPRCKAYSPASKRNGTTDERAHACARYMNATLSGAM